MLFINNITGILYNLNKYTQYKQHNEKRFEVISSSYLHLHTVIVLYHLDGNEKLL